MRFVIIGLAGIAFWTPVGAAQTIIVDPHGAGDYTQIQPAIDAARDGDEVLVQPGEYVLSARWIKKVRCFRGFNYPRGADHGLP